MVCACLLVPLGGTAEEPAAPRAQQPKARPAASKRPAAASRAKAADPIRRGTDALLEVERKIRDLEAVVHERRVASESRFSDLEFEGQLLERETQALSAEIAGIEKTLSEKRDVLARTEGEASSLSGEARQALDAVRRFLARLEKHIDEGIPWQVESRKKAIQNARDTIAAEGTTPARALTLAARAQEAEEALARGVEPGRVSMEIGGERQSIPAFRLGLLAVAYSSDDGTVLGCAQPGQSLEQGRIETKPGGEDTTKRAIGRVAAGYKEILAMLRRRIGPRVVDLYLPSVPVGGDKER